MWSFGFLKRAKTKKNYGVKEVLKRGPAFKESNITKFLQCKKKKKKKKKKKYLSSNFYIVKKSHKILQKRAKKISIL